MPLAAPAPWTIQLITSAVGAFIGGTATIGVVLLAQRMTWQRERELREREENNKQARHQKDYQIKSLIDLQESLDVVVMEYGLDPSSDKKVSVRVVNAVNRSILLASRVWDENLRHACIEFLTCVNMYSHFDESMSEEEKADFTACLGQKLHSVHAQFLEVNRLKVNRLIGDALRSLHG